MTRSLAAAVVLCAVACGDAVAAESRRVADPGGGTTWTATASATAGGRTCAHVAQGPTRKGRYCERLDEKTPYSYNVRYETPPDRARWRSVFTVVLSRQVASATLSTPEGVRRYTRGRGPRVLLAVVAGRVDQPPLVVRVRGSRGQTIVARGGRDPSAEVPDPLGGPGWRTVVEERSTRQVCVSWQRVPPRFGGEEGDPPEGERFRCGNPSLNVVATGVERAGGRVVVFGVVGPRVRRVALRGAGDPPLTFDRESRSVLAVLPEGADTALTLVATLADGRVVEQPLR